MQGYSNLNAVIGRAETAYTQHKIFQMQKQANSRMGGSVPVWGKAASPTEQIRENFQTALNTVDKAQVPAHAQAYAPSQRSSTSSQEFGFGDLVDMVNPLQHIPLVNFAYREITGDEIKPIAKIVGGAVFGGPLGAGSALVDTAIEAETGKDMAGHAKSIVTNELASSDKKIISEDHPQANLNAAIKDYENPDIGSAIAFADLGGRAEPITTRHMRPMPAAFSFND